jgi:hypothetical protein
MMTATDAEREKIMNIESVKSTAEVEILKYIRTRIGGIGHVCRGGARRSRRSPRAVAEPSCAIYRSCDKFMEVQDAGTTEQLVMGDEHGRLSEPRYHRAGPQP